MLQTPNFFIPSDHTMLDANVVLHVAIAACRATAEVVVTALCGVIGARCRIFKDPCAAANILSELMKWFLIPALLFTRVGETISPTTILEWWPTVVFPIIFNLYGMSLGLLLAFITRASAIQRRLFTACLGFHNTTSIPLMLMTSIGMSETDILASKDLRSPSEIVATGTALILLYTLVVTLQRWLIAYQILDISKLQMAILPRENTVAEESCTQIDGTCMDDSDIELQEMPVSETSGLTSLTPETSSTLSDATLQRNTNRVKQTVLWFTAKAKKLPPPVWAALLAFVIGLTPIRQLFFGEVGSKPQESNGQYMAFFTNAVSTLGTATVPITLVVLGVQISDGPQLSATLTKAMIGMIVVGNLLIRPAVGAGIVVAAAKLGILPVDAGAGKTMLFVLMLQTATPTAINLSVICNLHGSLEKEMATTLFWQYIFAIATATVSISGFLLILDYL